MDFAKLIARAQAILLSPKTEWPVIAAEQDTVANLYKNYIVVLAAIPAVAGFIKGSLIGFSMFGITVRTPIVSGIIGMIVSYVLALGDSLRSAIRVRSQEHIPLDDVWVLATVTGFFALWPLESGLFMPWQGASYASSPTAVLM